MKIHKQLLKVKTSDLDELNHVNNVRYVEWINNVAKEHWLKMATQSMLDHFFWIVLNHNIAYEKPAVLNDVILLKTYVTLTNGVTSTRVVEMYNNHNQQLLVKSETKFCFMDTKTKKPTRIITEVINLFH